MRFSRAIALALVWFVHEIYAKNSKRSLLISLIHLGVFGHDLEGPWLALSEFSTFVVMGFDFQK